jgi:hypothetical protein
MGKLRVFISSTMKDLVNERRAVEKQLRAFNIEPVNAEGWLPDGTKSWERIEREIRSSDVFVLIVGERYGWIPDKGPKSGLGRSVTHLEADEARALGLPVLPFLKELAYETGRRSGEAKRRDAFRAEVGSWDSGHFIAKFDDAFDLAEKVGGAVIGLLTDEFQRGRIRSRVQVVRSSSVALAGDSPAQKPPMIPTLPPRLVEAVANNKAVLFAGSGVSLAAGLPSAAFFAQSLIRIVRSTFPEYEANPVGSAFAGLATDVEGLAGGRAGLVEAVVGLVSPPQGLQPTPAHFMAVDLFDQIVTTNYDTLFEQADRTRGNSRPVLSSEIAGESLPDRAILNLHGSIDQPDSLVLVEREVLLLDQARPRLWRAVRDLLARKLVVVVGSSLRDPSIVRLFTEAGPHVSGYFIVPEFWGTTVARLRGWNLECIGADAESFLKALARERA